MTNLTDSKAMRSVAPAGKREQAPNYHIGLSAAIVLVCAVCFVALAYTAHSVTLFSFDLPVTQALQSFNPPWFDVPMRVVNWMGFGVQAIALVSAVVIGMFLAGWRWEALVTAIDAGSIWVLNILVGDIVNRAPPSPAEVSQVFLDLTHPSFPSGHVNSYIAIYGFAAFLVYQKVKQPWLRIPLLVFFGALILLIGPSRPYMGRHFPSDVLASLFLGIIWLILTLYVYQWGKGRFFAHHEHHA